MMPGLIAGGQHPLVVTFDASSGTLERMTTNGEQMRSFVLDPVPAASFPPRHVADDRGPPAQLGRTGVGGDPAPVPAGPIATDHRSAAHDDGRRVSVDAAALVSRAVLLDGGSTGDLDAPRDGRRDPAAHVGGSVPAHHRVPGDHEPSEVGVDPAASHLRRVPDDDRSPAQEEGASLDHDSAAERHTPAVLDRQSVDANGSGRDQDAVLLVAVEGRVRIRPGGLADQSDRPDDVVADAVPSDPKRVVRAASSIAWCSWSAPT